MNYHRQRLSKLVRSTALSVVFSLLAVVYLSIHSLAQLDPRERYGTYLGGTTSYVFDQDFGESHPPASTATTAATVDSAGNICVSGATSATDFPTTSDAYRRVANISFDDFNGKHSDGVR